MIAIRGAGSKIAEELEQLLPPGEDVAHIGRDQPMPANAVRFLFCQGLMRPVPLAEQSEAELAASFFANAGAVMRSCDRILEDNPSARICVIGSESGFAWSYDGAYAAAKAALHRHCETKRLGPGQ